MPRITHRRPATPHSPSPRRVACDGFSLIELLTVVAVLSVLAAIALQQYQTYRAASFDARAMHDIGNAAIAQEANFANAHAYVSFAITGPAVLAVPGLVVSDTITLSAVADDEKYTITSVSSRGTGKVFMYDSQTDTVSGN